MSFNSIKDKGLSDTAVNHDFAAIDEIVDTLQLITGHGLKSNNYPVSLKGMTAFFDKIKPVLNILVDRSLQINNGVMLARTGYHFIELLHGHLNISPQYVLDMLDKVVTCAAADSLHYDQSATKEIILITEKLLSDHRAILEDQGNFRNLVKLLDHFSNAGAVEAVELTWRLKEIIA
ncbi:hypothetical protein ACX0G7_26885 [Flavitalea antarctica]